LHAWCTKKKEDGVADGDGDERVTLAAFACLCGFEALRFVPSLCVLRVVLCVWCAE
jgi:hypothetical protein